MNNSFNKAKLALESIKIVSKNALNGKELTISDEQKQHRLDICNGCSSLKIFAKQMQCGECGCFLKLKAGLNDMKCPLNKWPVI